MTSVAAGSPEMWRDIALTNRDAIADGLHDIKQHLDAFLDALATADDAALTALFEGGKTARHKVVS